MPVCHVFGGADHRMLTERVVAEIIHHPILARAGAAGAFRIGVIDVRPVRGAIAGDRHRGPRLADLDLLHSGKQRTHAGGASLHHRRAADVGKAGHPGHPGQSKKRMLLRHGKTKNAIVDGIGRDFAVGQFLAQRLRGKLQRVEIGEGALPARERRAPIAAVGNLSRVCHFRCPPCVFDGALAAGCVWPRGDVRASPRRPPPDCRRQTLRQAA